MAETTIQLDILTPLGPKRHGVVVPGVHVPGLLREHRQPQRRPPVARLAPPHVEEDLPRLLRPLLLEQRLGQLQPEVVAVLRPRLCRLCRLA